MCMFKTSTLLTAAAITTCLSIGGGSALAGAVEPLTSELVANGLTRPIFVTHAPGDYTRVYVIEKQGRIRVVNSKTGAVQPLVEAFLNIDPLVGGGTSTNDERGLLGLAFHPDFENNGYFYINYTNNSNNTVVARYTALSPDQADTGSAQTVITFSQPFTNHNGGWLGFGPLDGYLYIATGDGGSGGDPGNRAQDITNQPLGKMLRVDIDGDDFPADANKNYAIPKGNPFVDAIGDDEIWHYGLRNPWRPSFDRATGDLYIADVGQGQWEEVNFARNNPPGLNFGWRCYEGNHAFNTGGCPPAGQLTFPVHEYNHSTGLSITGGYAYRGCAIPSLDGTYFFADYAFSRIWSFRMDGGNVVEFTTRTAELEPPGAPGISNIASFGEDARGEIYICDQSGGEIFKIVPVTPTIAEADLDCDGDVDFDDFTLLLAQFGDCSGCIADLDGDHDVDFDDFTALLAQFD